MTVNFCLSCCVVVYVLRAIRSFNLLCEFGSFVAILSVKYRSSRIAIVDHYMQRHTFQSINETGIKLFFRFWRCIYVEFSEHKPMS